MSAEENKTIFLRFIRELNQGNLAVIDEVCSPNFVFYSPRRIGRAGSKVREN